MLLIIGSWRSNSNPIRAGDLNFLGWLSTEDQFSVIIEIAILLFAVTWYPKEWPEFSLCSSGNHYRCREWLFSRNTAVLISQMIYCCIYLHHSISGALDGYIWNCCSWFSVQRSIPLWSYWVQVYRHFLHLPYAKPQSLWSAVEVFLQSPWKRQLPVPDILQLCLSAMDERRRTSFQETTHCESKEDRRKIFVWQVLPRTEGCFLSRKLWLSFEIGVVRKKETSISGSCSCLLYTSPSPRDA